MRRLGLTIALLILSIGNTGCLLNMYSADPNERMQQLIYQSEDYRQIKAEWFRFWMIDQPSHMTYDRIHGGIGP